jgi:hypothetical protein
MFARCTVPRFSTGRIGLLVTDFDDTLTSADTTPIIIEQAFLAAEKVVPRRTLSDYCSVVDHYVVDWGGSDMYCSLGN